MLRNMENRFLRFLTHGTSANAKDRFRRVFSRHEPNYRLRPMSGAALCQARNFSFLASNGGF